MRQMILGTDWWTDCDDAVALRVLARAHKAGEVNLLGVVINACMKDSVASLKGFLKKEGIEGLPVGLDAEATDFGGPLTYQMRLAADWYPEGSNEEAEKGVKVYRKLLAEAEGKVEILEIGFLQVVAALLQSEADEISPKTGMELVREKVAKFWVMAGKWDADGEAEHNFCRNQRSRTAGEIFCRCCPVPVTFLGWEVGINVISGGKLSEGDVLKQVLFDHGSFDGRHSWDPMLVMLALAGDEEAAGYDAVIGYASLDPATGKNYFRKDALGPHRYVVKKHTDEYYAEAINEKIG